MKNEPLVSIIIPTKNSASTLEACLKSINNQTYKNIEVIVVDNNSADNTKSIARKFTNLVFDKGPERSAQRNFGASKSKGEYLLFIDSDMELEEKVVEDCVYKININNNSKAVIIPEVSFGEGFWAECKALERSFYIGVDWIEAARFFRKDVFDKVGGYDENCISGEDFDLHLRVKKLNKIRTIERSDHFIRHNEGRPSIFVLLKKKFYYGGKITNYQKKLSNKKYFNNQVSILNRYTLFFKKPLILFKNPLKGFGVIFLKTAEFISGGLGLLISKFNLLKYEKHY